MSDTTAKPYSDGGSRRSSPARSPSPTTVASGLKGSVVGSSSGVAQNLSLAFSSSSQGTFKCTNCELNLSHADRDPNRPDQCRKDSVSYKALSYRWSKARALKLWWDNQAHDGRVLWFRKQHALQPGAKRKFEDLNYTDSSADSRFRQTGEVDMWQTFEDFETGKLLRGWASLDILAAFKDIVEKHSSECLYVRGSG